MKILNSIRLELVSKWKHLKKKIKLNNWAIHRKSSREFFKYFFYTSIFCLFFYVPVWLIILIANFILSLSLSHIILKLISLMTIKLLRNLSITKKKKSNDWIQIYFNVIHFIDYDYDFVGFSDYRGGYNEFYDDYYRSFDGDYPYSSSVAPGGVGQRPGRQNSVGFKSFFDFK